MIGEVLSFERVDGIDETKVDLGGGDVRTAQHFAPAGVDSVPLPGDKAALEDSVGAGNVQTTGYHDTKNEGVAVGGEHRVYSRDAQGVVRASVWLKNDGSIVIEADGPIEVRSTSTVTVDSPDVRLGGAAGQRVACEGDLVSVIVPLLQAVTTPVTAVNPLQQTATGYVAAGQIISGRLSVKAGP
jgi:hypothetical protein